MLGADLSVGNGPVHTFQLHRMLLVPSLVLAALPNNMRTNLFGF